MDTKVYSEDRVRRLRWVLWIIGFVSGVVALFAIGLIAKGDDVGVGVFVMVTGVVILGLSLMTLRLLPARERPAKRAAVTTGVVTLVASLLLAGTWASYLLPILALVLIFLAVVSDEPEGVAEK